jgi:hypothetical protein
MPLSALIPVVVIGIAGIAVLLHLLGLSAPRRLAEPSEALEAWTREFPNAPAVAAHLSADQRAALILLANGATGLVWCIGADTVARPLLGADVIDTGTGLEVYLHDMAAPHVSVVLSPQDRTRWKEFILA